MKITVKIQNCYTSISLSNNCPISVENKIYSVIIDVCTYKYSTYSKSILSPQGTFIDKVFPLYLNLNSVPTGFIWEILDELDIYKEDFNIIDNRIKPPTKPNDYWFNFELDEKQIECIEKGLASDRGYFEAATGSGKTAIMISLLSEIGGRTLIIEPSIDLVNQIAKDIKESTNIIPDKIMGKASIKMSKQSKVVVASIATLNMNLKNIKNWLSEFNTIMGDEIHHTGIAKGSYNRKTKTRTQTKVNGYYKVFMNCDAYYRFGFSATITEPKFVRAITGNKISTIEEDYLIESGRLSKPYIFIFNIKHNFILDYRDSYRDNILNNQYRNQTIIDIAKFFESQGLSTLIMVNSKQIQLQELYKNSNYTLMVGNTKSKDRERIYQNLQDKKILVLMLTIGKEGKNIPSVDVIIRAAGIKSKKMILQEKGRGMRVTKDKNRVYIIDFYDDDGTKKIREHSGWKTHTGVLRKQSDFRYEHYRLTKLAEIKEIFNINEFKIRVKEIENGN